MAPKILLGSVSLGIILVVGAYFVISPKVSDAPADVSGEEVRGTSEHETYRSDEYGFTFLYSKGVDGYGVYEPAPRNEALAPLKTLVLIHHDDAPDYGEAWPVNGEGPATITINVFKNERKQWSRQWADENTLYSNINTVLGEVREATVGGANAIRYRADGLYASEVAVVAHGSYVYVVSGAFVDESSPTLRDFEQILESITFIQESAEDENNESVEEPTASVATPETQASVPAPAQTTPVTATPKPSGYSAAEVAMHAGAASCWSVINGNVYDLTAWVPKHPGGERNILKLCGKDGTSLFEGQHGGDSKPEAILGGYLLGALTE